MKDPELEQKLINYYNELQEELYPISSELLTYECLNHNENFLGGVESPNFKPRVADFLRNWRRRNLKRLRMPTSSGQKLPEGYTGKWEASSYYFYLETKGYDPQWVYHGDETNLPDEDVPTKVYADLGAPRVHVRTSGQDKDNKTAFLVQNTFGGKLPLYPILRGDNQANRPGFHTKKNNSTVRQRFQAKINEFMDARKKSKSLWKGLQFWVNGTAYMDEEAFLHWGRTVWKYRAGTSGEVQPPSVLLLDDLRTHKTKRVMDEFKALYNTKIIILPGGLTPKAQIMDVVNNRPFKVNVRSKQLKLRLKKYKEVKAAQARNPLLKARSGIPTLTREEHVHIMLQAWAELSPELGAKAWVAVKLMPYELAQQVGWTPKDAFADVRHCDYPWQAVSKIRPSEVDAEDMDAIEWDNVSMDFYVSKKYVEVYGEFAAPVEPSEEIDEQDSATTSVPELPSLQAQILAIAKEATANSSTESDDSERLFPQHTFTPAPETPAAPPAMSTHIHTCEVSQTAAHPTLPLPSAVFTMSKPRSFKFRLPQAEACTNPDCTQEDPNTVNRCHRCNTPAHGACLNDRLYCTPCYNQHMVEHKAALAQKRKAAKELKHTSTGIEKQSKKQKVPSQQALTTPATPAAKKPKMSGGLSRSKSNSKSTQSVGTKSSMVQFCTPLQRASSEKPFQRAVSALARAEQRQLQEAIALSKSEAAPDTPKKEPSAGDYQKMLQQSMIVSPRTEGSLI